MKKPGTPPSAEEGSSSGQGAPAGFIPQRVQKQHVHVLPW